MPKQLRSHPHCFATAGALEEPLSDRAIAALTSKPEYQAMVKLVGAISSTNFEEFLESLPPDQRNVISEEKLGVSQLSMVLRRHVLPPDQVLMVRVSNISEALATQQPVIGQAYSLLYFRFGGHCSYHMNIGGLHNYPNNHSDHLEGQERSMFPHLCISDGSDSKVYQKHLTASERSTLAAGSTSDVELMRSVAAKRLPPNSSFRPHLRDRAWDPIHCATGCQSGWDLRRFVPMRAEDVEMLSEAELLSGAQYQTLHDLLVDKEYQYEYEHEYEYQ